MFTFTIDDDSAALAEHMSSLAREAPAARINAAQCGLVLERLRYIFEMLTRLPDARPTPQLVTVFRSADALVQRMRHTWQRDLRRHFTCRALFAALFDRVQCVWRLHSTSHWADEHRAAISADEAANAALLALLLRADEVGITHTYRRKELSQWKVPLNALAPPQGETLAAAAMALPARRLIFAAHHHCEDSSYTYEGVPVTLAFLNPDPSRITSETLTCFVQDMVNRASWCHPCLVPHIGAFTEVFPHAAREAHVWFNDYKDNEVYMDNEDHKDNEDNEDYKENEGRLEKAQLALGIITEDPASLAVSGDAWPLLRLVPSDTPGASGYVSLHELLFVRRQSFSLRAAIDIARQVADALQYILMDDVPDEVADARCAVAPSHIFVCPIARSGRDGGNDMRSDDIYSDVQSYCGRYDSSDDGVRFAALYSPPVYVANGPFSRWRPHPHAADPASYAIAQLIIALLSNRPPYPSLRRQSELAARVFAPEESDGVVRVNIPFGSSIPADAPRGIRRLCLRALALRSPRQAAQGPRVGVSLEELREGLAGADALGDDDKEEEDKGDMTVGWRHVNNSWGNVAVPIEMNSSFGPIGDYGEFSTDDDGSSSDDADYSQV